MGIGLRPELRTRVREVLDDLASNVGADLAFDADGNCFFEHSTGGYCALMMVGQDQLVAGVSLAAGHSPDAETLAEALVDFGWIGARTGGAALSYNPNSDSFVLWKSFEAETVSADDINLCLFRLLAHSAQVEAHLTALFGGEVEEETSDAENEISGLRMV